MRLLRFGALALAASLLSPLAPAADGARAPVAEGARASATGDEPSPVRAPHWGDALFRVYQGHTFDALTSLLASQHFQRVAPHDDEATAMQGGLLLAYGLHDPAEALFTSLAERGTSAAVRDRAWFYLARTRWQRGLPNAAEEALGHIAAPLAGDLEADRRLLAAQLRLAAGDPVGAASQLGALADADRPAARYARYNLGVALLAAGDLAGGRRWLLALATQPAFSPEERSLRDRSRLALGFAALQAGQPAEARAQLEHVRLQGPFSNKALLGFGWAAAALDHPKDALVPWQELQGRDPSDAAVLEARLAVPHALAELKAYGQANDGYGQAIEAFDAEAHALDESIAAVRSGTLVDSLLAKNPGADLGWLWRVQDLPELPHPSQLLALLASHGFQEALKDQRDLRFLLANLQQWQRDLVVYDDMLATRRQAFAAQLPAVQQPDRAARLQALQARQAEMTQALATARADADGRALADAAEQAAMTRLARAQAALAQLPADEAAPLRARLDRVQAALTWQLAVRQPERLWGTTKALRDLDDRLAHAAQQEAALASAQADEPARFAGFADRIAGLARRVANLLPQVATLRAEQQQAVQDMAVQALQSQRERLREYGTQARFALAQLQDRATLARAATAGRNP